MNTSALIAKTVATICVLLSGCGAPPKDGITDPRDADVMADASVISDGTAGPQGDAIPFDCSVTAPTSCPDPPLRYPDVAPIFHNRCTAACHAGVVDGPWPLTDYQHVADWWDVIRDDLLSCAMPPPDAGVPITNEERTAILTWIRCGFPP